MVSDNMDISIEKENLRKSVYDSIFENDLSNRLDGDYGKIPDFKGSDLAAKKLASTIEWKTAQTIFSSPDAAQTPVRYLALMEGKNLIMASPNLENGYLFLESSKTRGNEMEAATKEGAFEFASSLDISDYPSVDLVVEGSVAVDMDGNRLGKGCAYGDQEIEFLFDYGLIDDSTPIVTTIHPIQLVVSVPMEEHDEKLNMIVTTDEIIRI